MNTQHTQLKKGDKCQSPYGIAEIHSFGVEACLLKLPDGSFRSMFCDKLTRIPTRAERMQAVLEIAWDVENRLQDDETVQLKVGALVEFARQFVKMQESIIDLMRGMQDRGNQAKIDMEKAEKILKGETL